MTEVCAYAARDVVDAADLEPQARRAAVNTLRGQSPVTTFVTPAIVTLAAALILPLGYVALVRSALPLSLQTAIAGVAGLVLGALAFYLLNVAPMRKLRAALAALDEEMARHAEARREAASAGRAKSHFLAAASHDLRQPLHALGLYAAVLEEKVGQPEVRELTHSINASVDALENLFSAIIDISKLDAGMLATHVDTVSLDALLGRVRSEFGAAARTKGLELRVRACPCTVRSDAALLQRIVNNLVANAIRYTDHGGVLIGCRRRGSHLRLQVWDTGIGIAAHELPSIFEEFYQVGNAERERSKGLGLGLAMVRRLGTLLGHSIDVQSRRGRGSCFSVNLPIDTAG